MLTGFKEAIDIYSWLRKNWEQPIGLITVLALILSVFLMIFIKLDIEEIGKSLSLLELLTIIIMLGVTWGFWWHTRKLPISPPG